MRSPVLPILSLAATLQAAAPLTLDAPLRKVRVHPDEAWVTRIGQATLPARGTHRLVLAGLPEGLRLEDVRVSAQGPAGTRLGDLTVGSEPLKVMETTEYRALKERHAELQKALDLLHGEREALAQEAAFLKGLQAVQDKEISARLASSVPAAEAVVGLSRGVQERLAQSLARERQVGRDLVKQQEALQQVEAELRRKAAERLVSPAKASLELTTTQAGVVQVAFTYRVRGARWEPTYEARLAADGRSLELVLFAAIRHEGKEDWNGVEVEVTQARSARNVTLDRIQGPQWVRYSEQAPYGSQYRPSGAATVEVITTPSGGYAAPTPPATPSTLVDAAPAQAKAVESTQGLATTWVLEGPKDIPADGDAHRFRVAATEVQPELGLVCIPRQDPTVYRVARFAVPRDLPIFPGSAVVHFAGSQSVGQGALELPAPGQPLQLGFGPFQGVRVALRRLEARKDTVGTFSKETQWVVKDRFEVSNDLAEAVTVEVQEALLKSEQDKIRITPLADTTPGAEELPTGARQWHVAVAPGATAGLTLGTQVRVPMGGYVTGLGLLNLPH